MAEGARRVRTRHGDLEELRGVSSRAFSQPIFFHNGGFITFNAIVTSGAFIRMLGILPSCNASKPVHQSLLTMGSYSSCQPVLLMRDESRTWKAFQEPVWLRPRVCLFNGRPTFYPVCVALSNP